MLDSIKSGVGAAILAGTVISMVAITVQAKPPKTKIDAPTIGCVTASATQTSLTVQVCAGATGLPAGFSLQWMKAADLALAGGIWPSDETVEVCAAGFSGNANLSRYNLAPGECVPVDIGEFLFDNGASTDCPDGLLCGTEYVFRGFGHATSTLQRSVFTTNLTCATLSCDQENTCTYTQGYWKTHGPVPTGNNLNEWSVASLTLGTVLYTDVQLQAILDTPAAGNGLIALAHQLIAAKLNLANGADGTDAAAAIAAADALIAGLVVPPVGVGSLPPATTSALTASLSDYNEGATGPGHCQ
jgi:hypothetical protein